MANHNRVSQLQSWWEDENSRFRYTKSVLGPLLQNELIVCYIRAYYNMIQRLIYCFSHNARHYSEVLPPHITKILKDDEALSIQKYHSCRNYISSLLNNAKAEEDCKIKANLLFSTHCFNEALDELKPVVSELILEGVIRSQYELDQVGKWLNK